MSTEAPDLGRVKHTPMYLLPYADFDGPYAGDTDCIYLSLGWAQYDPRTASLKTLRHVGSKWSRQSEELPLHRVIDLAILLVRAIRNISGSYLGTINLPPGTLENQSTPVLMPGLAGSTAESSAFVHQMANNIVRQRLRKLRDELNELHDSGRL